MVKVFETGAKLAEGKTKIVYAHPSDAKLLVLEHKDAITAGDGARRDELKDKGAISCRTTANVFEFLNKNGVATHFVSTDGHKRMVVHACEMIPLEVVRRRIATGSYLKRNPEVEEGEFFPEPVHEWFIKDDARHDPIATGQQIVKEGIASVEELKQMRAAAGEIFALLEKAWATQSVQLVDLKIEFGRRKSDGKLVVADVIDNDSWRIWPEGRKEEMLDKQVYRNLPNITADDLKKLKGNYERVAQMTEAFKSLKIGEETADEYGGQVVILMGSKSDLEHARKIGEVLEKLGVVHEYRVASAHRNPESLLKIVREYDGQAEVRGTRLVYVAVAGLSNALSGLLAGETINPIVSCPPFAPEDLHSTLRMPTGVSHATVLNPENAALYTVKILAHSNPELRRKLIEYYSDAVRKVEEADAKLRGKKTSELPAPATA